MVDFSRTAHGSALWAVTGMSGGGRGRDEIFPQQAAVRKTVDASRSSIAGRNENGRFALGDTPGDGNNSALRGCVTDLERLGVAGAPGSLVGQKGGLVFSTGVGRGGGGGGGRAVCDRFSPRWPRNCGL